MSDLLWQLGAKETAELNSISLFIWPNSLITKTFLLEYKLLFSLKLILRKIIIPIINNGA